MIRGEHFYKMSGSGNDFVAFDRLGQGSEVSLPDAELVRALCRRGEGVGADGVLVLTDTSEADYRLVYYNADGSRAELCGNASLCGVRLAVELGRGAATGVSFLTDAGQMRGRLVDGLPEIDLTSPRELAADSSALWEAVGGAEAGELRIGYVRVGVPHLVVLCDAAESVDLGQRGPLLRRHPALVHGANVNFVSSRPDGSWDMRTFERGVEGETLACGTGSVATALLLATWSGTAGDSAAAGDADTATPIGPRGPEAATTVSIRTRSGRLHLVTLRPAGEGFSASLAGEGRIVYRGELAELY